MIAFVRRLLVFLVRILVGARSDWRGCEPDTRRRIYFANHGSHFDTVAVMAALPWPVRRLTHPIAASDYWGTTKFRKFIAEKCLRAVLVDRKPRVHSDPLGPLAQVLEDGRSILIFPEGTRSSTGEVVIFRSGLFHLARRFPDVDLIPIYLDNLSRILPKGSWLIVPITCTARFGTPMRLMPGEEKAAFLDRARQAVVALGNGSGGQ
jgi:1-acyl-sn-glycerol-3-phosphate acyltransferase